MTSAAFGSLPRPCVFRCPSLPSSAPPPPPSRPALRRLPAMATGGARNESDSDHCSKLPVPVRGRERLRRSGATFPAKTALSFPARRPCFSASPGPEALVDNLPNGEADRLTNLRGRKRRPHFHRHLVTANLECDRPDWRRHAMTRLALQILHHPPPHSLVERMVTSYARPPVMSRPTPQYLVVGNRKNTRS